MKTSITRLKEIANESIQVKQEFSNSLFEKIFCAIEKISKALKDGRKLILMGNGGSAADAQHIAAEMVVRFKKERKALPAIALHTDTSCLTAISNDYSYNKIFSRQIEAFCNKGDVVLGISTSGNSENIILGIKKAKELSAITIALTGMHGGKLNDIADIVMNIPSRNTARIQESHILLGHMICEIVEEEID
jgi:D-sedoheptulose 7-phosphate isomerase